MSEVEDHVKRITMRKGVKGIIILDSQGVPIRDTFDEASRVLTIQYAHLISLFVEKSRATIRELDPTNDLQLIRLRSVKHEIIVAPDRDFTLIAVQEPDCT
eukprot:TRINITY_DN4249_c0_g1_i2.p2 TRINITY_DN4249_c0_g1~~TRINITY_DN4249_c0_g1_i2.p2  ORF type:complete len:101 (+),score=7.66 TRINITY_DN4249_c0_g1_i2:94-396(+)